MQKNNDVRNEPFTKKIVLSWFALHPWIPKQEIFNKILNNSKIFMVFRSDVIQISAGCSLHLTLAMPWDLPEFFCREEAIPQNFVADSG